MHGLPPSAAARLRPPAGPCSTGGVPVLAPLDREPGSFRALPAALLAVAALAPALGAGGCVEPAPGSGSSRGQRDRSAAAAYLDPASPPRHPARATFGNAIELEGWDLQPEALAPGGTATLTLHWRARDDIEGAWKVFVHVDGREGQPRLIADHWPAGGTWPTDAWRPGDRVRDPVSLGVPAGYRGSVLDVWVGWYRGEERLRLAAGPQVRHDGRDRLLLATISLAPGP